MSEQPTEPQPDQPDEPAEPEDTPSSHETSGQFPADDVAKTFEQ